MAKRKLNPSNGMTTWDRMGLTRGRGGSNRPMDGKQSSPGPRGVSANDSASSGTNRPMDGATGPVKSGATSGRSPRGLGGSGSGKPMDGAKGPVSTDR